MTKLPQMDPVDPTPPPPLDMTPPPPPAKPPSKLRTYISIAVLIVIVGFVLWSVRNKTDADNLKVGTCFDEPAAGKDFSTVEKHECTEPHDAEVVFVTEYTDQSDTLPIKLTMDSFVGDACVPAIELYTGRVAEDIQELGMGYITPNADGWKDGDRTITCYVYNLDASKLTTSVKGAPAAS
ncbi:MAG TPA: septum formation family protein [Candidatus Limnocylindrales bacterium]|nr:septum formation family protein [Candidatus Limnocylindrales bacterium]